MMEHLKGKRLLITGGTGFVGRHLVRHLSESGAEISCLVRSSSNRALLPGFVRPVEADLATGRGLQDAVAGQDMVIHMAALLFGLGWRDYLSANARAAESLGAAVAREGKASRLLLVSSLAATGPSALSPGVRDDALPAPVSAYGWSKLMAEQILGRHLGDRLVVLRPPIIYGSGDKGLLPYFQSAKLGFVATPGMGRPFPVSAVHAHDMARAIVCALRPEANGVYHCNDGAEHSMGAMGKLMAELQGRKAVALGLPLPLMGAAAGLATMAGALLCRFGMRVPSWNMDKYREAREEGWLCQGTRIRSELGYTPLVSLREGLTEAIEGYRASGWL